MHGLSIMSNPRHQLWHCMCALGPDGRLIILDHSMVKEKKFVFSRVKLCSAFKLSFSALYACVQICRLPECF